MTTRSSADVCKSTHLVADWCMKFPSSASADEDDSPLQTYSIGDGPACLGHTALATSYPPRTHRADDGFVPCSMTTAAARQPPISTRRLALISSRHSSSSPPSSTFYWNCLQWSSAQTGDVRSATALDLVVHQTHSELRPSQSPGPSPPSSHGGSHVICPRLGSSRPGNNNHFR